MYLLHKFFNNFQLIFQRFPHPDLLKLDHPFFNYCKDDQIKRRSQLNPTIPTMHINSNACKSKLSNLQENLLNY